MTIADKLKKIAERVPILYEEGRTDEYDAFWDALQNNGEPRDYSWFGSGITWTDAVYNPKHPIVCTAFFNLFRNARITDTKVPVDLSRCTSGTHFCFELPNLVRIPKVIVSENTPLTYCIYACYELQELRFEGTIGKSLDLHFSKKLSAESYDNIFGCLSLTATGVTLTVPSNAPEVYNAKYGASHWEFVESVKPNWTFAYA